MEGYRMNEIDKTDEIEQLKQNEAWKRERFDRFTADMSTELKAALEDVVFSQVYLETIHVEDKNAILKLEYNAGYERTLTLIDVFGVPEGDYHELDFEDFSLNLADGLYCLAGETYNWDDDTSKPFAIRFKDASVNVSVYNAMYETYTGTPWDRLTSIAWTIMNKYSLSENYVNDKEKELLPLIAELCTLTYWGEVPKAYHTTTLPILKDYANKYGYKKVYKLLKQFELTPEDSKARLKASISLFNELNFLKYEPMWRELYNQLAITQADYPAKTDALCPVEFLTNTREQIQKHLETLGYIGTYPNFNKAGSIMGIRLAESYNLSYFVGLEKNANHLIHCTEAYDNDHLTIEFLCGTELLKKKDTPGDIYSCTFNAKGQRYSQTVIYNTSVPMKEATVNYTTDSPAEESNIGVLEDYVRIATKRAELKKLTKAERKLITGIDGGSLSLFLFIFIIMGGLFGLFMTLGFMAMAVLCALLFGQPQVIPDMITEIPWWGCLAFCWIAFGLSMGIITVLVKRK